MGEKLQGIFTPNLVPLDRRGDINEDELRRYIDWLIDHGVHGLYPNGSTGEFTRFTVEERRRIIKIVCEQCDGRRRQRRDCGSSHSRISYQRHRPDACRAHHEHRCGRQFQNTVPSAGRVRIAGDASDRVGIQTRAPTRRYCCEHRNRARQSGDCGGSVRGAHAARPACSGGKPQGESARLGAIVPSLFFYPASKGG